MGRIGRGTWREAFVMLKTPERWGDLSEAKSCKGTGPKGRRLSWLEPTAQDAPAGRTPPGFQQGAWRGESLLRGGTLRLSPGVMARAYLVGRRNGARLLSLPPFTQRDWSGRGRGGHLLNDLRLRPRLALGH